ncbi:MAG TPA: hypothetical protein VK177_13280 [Flavobacteriales bacterium]|nr:hypothetical protein [Flavobacteriales bacterium]
MKKFVTLFMLSVALVQFTHAQIKIKVPDVGKKDKDKNKEKNKEKENAVETKTTNTTNNTSNNKTTVANYKEGDIVEFNDGTNWIEGEVTQVGGSGRYQVKHGTLYTWVYPKEMRATNKANTVEEENKRLAAFPTYKVGDFVTWDEGRAELSVAEIGSVVSQGVYKIRYSGTTLTADKIKGIWNPVYKVGDKVVIPDRGYNNYPEKTIVEVGAGYYKVEGDNYSHTGERFWPVYDYKGFYTIYSKISSDDMVIFTQMLYLNDGKDERPSTVTTEKIKNFLANTDVIENELKQKYSNPPAAAKGWENPSAILKTLSRRRELIGQHYLANPMKRLEEYFVGLTQMKIDDMKRGSNNMHKADEWLGLVNPDAQFEADFKELYDTEIKAMEEQYAAIGQKAPAYDENAVFAKVKALQGEYEKTLFATDWMAKQTDPFNTKDASLEPMVREFAQGNDAKATITKIGFAAGDWEKYESTEWWVAGRAKYAMVWVNSSAYKYKQIYFLKIAQEYLGNGKYGKTYIEPQAFQKFFYAK